MRSGRSGVPFPIRLFEWLVELQRDAGPRRCLPANVEEPPAGLPGPPWRNPVLPIDDRSPAVRPHLCRAARGILRVRKPPGPYSPAAHVHVPPELRYRASELRPVAVAAVQLRGFYPVPADFRLRAWLRRRKE